MHWRIALVLLSGSVGLLAQASAQESTSQPSSDRRAGQVAIGDAKFACPMETHPDETDVSRQGAYLAVESGKCPWCGMRLKPADELAWVKARRAAQGSEVAYTCPDHQHVFSRAVDKCPRCERGLSPFKVMYTCPNPQHASQVRTEAGVCPLDQRQLTPFRGIWLSPEMADRNVAGNTHLAEQAAYRCSLHPLVHSDKPGHCTICAQPLKSPTGGEAVQIKEDPLKAIPAGATYVCPMDVCWYFAAEPGECPECGMDIKPIAEVPWAAALPEAQPAVSQEGYACPMHAKDVRPNEPGTCPVCGMQLVKADTLESADSGSAEVRQQVDYLMEHYLALHRRFSSDRSDDVALHALGLVGAADEILRRVSDPEADVSAGARDAARDLRAAALKLNGKGLDADRVTFVAVGGAMRRLVAQVRPSKQRYPRIYMFHCPMTKGDWLQAGPELANPFYGFKMLNCGELLATE